PPPRPGWRPSPRGCGTGPSRTRSLRAREGSPPAPPGPCSGCPRRRRAGTRSRVARRREALETEAVEEAGARAVARSGERNDLHEAFRVEVDPPKGFRHPLELDQLRTVATDPRQLAADHGA